MKKLIFGYGATGKSVEAYFQNNKIEYLIYDENIELNIPNDMVFVQSRFNEIDEVIISPGIKPTHPLIQEINSHGLFINTDIEIFDNHYKGKIIGVTGTNGKTTFVNLLTDYLNSQKIKSIAVGNVGKSPLEIIDEEYEFVVMELSSFQLHYIKNLHLFKAIVLNIHQDHLDWHSDYEDYRKAKLKIWDFLRVDDQDTGKIDSYESDQFKETFSKAGILENVSKLPFHEGTLYSFIKAVSDLGLNTDNIYYFLSNYKIEEHRFEFVDKFNDVIFINDSKSTNFHSLSVATAKIKNGILVLHGLTKNITSADLNISKNIKTILVPKDLEIDLSNVDAKIIKLNSIFDIEKALIEIIQPDDTVLFSCGGASFNNFENYEERGNFFKSVVLKIKEKNG